MEGKELDNLMENQQSPYSNSSSGKLPSQGFLKKMEWWIAGLGWANCVIAIIMFGVMIATFPDADTFNELAMEGNVTFAMLRNPAYLACYMGSLLLAFAVLVLSIIDMIQVNKVTGKFVGLLLFCLFCRPGYIIWREHILGQKKTLGIVNIVIWVLYFILAFGMIFSWMVKLIAGMM